MNLIGAVVPHAPLLVPELGGTAVAERAQPVRDAVARLGLDGVDAAVLISPHAQVTGVYAAAEGTLDGFGAPGFAARRETETGLVERMGAAAGFELLEGPLDHGALVPLLLGAVPEIPVAVVGLREVTGPGGAPAAEVVDASARVGAAIAGLSNGASVAIVVSAHGSAGLTPGAPLTERPGAAAFEDALVGALTQDAAHVGSIPPEDWAAAGACGGGPLLALAGAFAGRAFDVLHHSAPFGVGYLVARSR
ncbi:MAG: hypothetical protein ABR575_11590 [Actinomycetota bacterium]